MSESEHSSDVDAFAARAIDDVAGARRSCSLPGEQSGPSELLEALRRVRAHLDRIEVWYGRLVLARTRAANRVQELGDAAQDAWDREAVEPDKVLTGRELAPRERYARFNLGTVDQQILLRRARADLETLTGTLEYVRIHHRGAEGVRRDLETIIRGMTFERSLDR